MKRAHIPIVSILVATLAGAPAAGQEPPEAALEPAQPSPPPAPGLTPIGLEAAIEKAIAQNPQIVAGQLTVDAAISARKASRANFLPILSADLTAMYFSEKPGFGELDLGTIDPSMCALFGLDELDEQAFCNGLLSGFSGMSDMSSSFQAEQYDVKLTLTIAQPLTPLYQAYHGYKLAELGIDMALVEKEKNEADLKMRTVEAYYGYLKARAALGAIDEAIVGVEAHVKKAEAFFAADFMTKNDLLQAQVRLAQLKGQRLEIEQGVVLAREAFLLLLNEPAGAPLEPEDSPEAELAFVTAGGIPDEAKAIDLAKKNRPEVKQIENAIAQAGTAVKLLKGGFIPQLSAFGSYQKEWGAVMELPDFVVGASLSWNFFQWGKVYYSVDEAKAKKAAAEAGLEAVERATELEVKQALLAIALSEKQIEIQVTAVDAAKEQLRIEQDRYDKQVSTTTEVLDATTRLVQAQVELASYRYEHVVALARLRKACGTL